MTNKFKEVSGKIKRVITQFIFLRFPKQPVQEVEITEEQAIPEQHKTIVRERIRKSMPEELQSWKSARKQLNFKSM